MLHPTDLLIVWMILAPEPVNLDFGEVHRPEIIPSLIRVNLTLQLVGSHETYGNLNHEIGYSRSAWREVFDAPRVEDTWTLPTYKQAMDTIEIYQRTIQTLEEKAMLYSWHRDICGGLISQIRADMEPCRLIAVAQDRVGAWKTKRVALHTLREQYPTFFYSRGLARD